MHSELWFSDSMMAWMGMDGRIMCCSIISSCHSAATSEIVKRLWSPVRLCMRMGYVHKIKN